eukprot:COSAG02_NODE_35779_length_463_cov_1.521978_1_plen_90_part_01
MYNAYCILICVLPAPAARAYVWSYATGPSPRVRGGMRAAMERAYSTHRSERARRGKGENATGYTGCRTLFAWCPYPVLDSDSVTQYWNSL